MGCVAGEPAEDVAGAEDVDVEAGAATTPEVFRTSTRFAVVNPKNVGAAGNGTHDDTAALRAAIDALPAAGGIVVFPPGTYLKREQLLRIQKSHVFLWAPNGRATLHGTNREYTAAERANPSFCGVRQQATIFDRTTGGGVFGLKFTSNANKREACGESNQIAGESVTGFEVVGVEVNTSVGCGVFVRRTSGPASSNIFIEGNYVHHTRADSFHHTGGTRKSAVWNNFIFNEAPTLGDDGVACVTYGPDSPKCGQMEWWNNIYLGGAHGRGLAVIGGEQILAHHNWIIGSASAGLIAGSENAYDSATVDDVEFRDNWLVRSPNGSVQNGHAGILFTGGNAAAPAMTGTRAIDNVVIQPAGNRVQRTEGKFDAATVGFTNTQTARAALPGPEPTIAQARPRDTSILRTRDLNNVPAANRKGLYRIHLREKAGGGGALEERFEYVVAGTGRSFTRFLNDTVAAGGYLSERRGDVALLLTPVPLAVPANVDAVTFDQMRAGDRDGMLSWLWARVDNGTY